MKNNHLSLIAGLSLLSQSLFAMPGIVSQTSEDLCKYFHNTIWNGPQMGGLQLTLDGDDGSFSAEVSYYGGDFLFSEDASCDNNNDNSVLIHFKSLVIKGTGHADGLTILSGRLENRSEQYVDVSGDMTRVK
jgi:hypothetical protein